MHPTRSRRDSRNAIPTVERPTGRGAIGRMLAVAAGLLLTALACALPAGGGSGGDPVATAVAATLQAATGTAPEGPIASPVPTTGVEPPSAANGLGDPAGSFSLAYTSGGEAWLIEGDGPGRQLSTTGGVVQVVISSDGQRIAFARREQIDMPSEIWASQPRRLRPDAAPCLDPLERTLRSRRVLVQRPGGIRLPAGQPHPAARHPGRSRRAGSVPLRRSASARCRLRRADHAASARARRRFQPLTGRRDDRPRPTDLDRPGGCRRVRPAPGPGHLPDDHHLQRVPVLPQADLVARFAGGGRRHRLGRSAGCGSQRYGVADRARLSRRQCRTSHPRQLLLHPVLCRLARSRPGAGRLWADGRRPQCHRALPGASRWQRAWDVRVGRCQLEGVVAGQPTLRLLAGLRQPT